MEGFDSWVISIVCRGCVVLMVAKGSDTDRKEAIKEED
jgi:hypothetical protein